MIEAVRAVKNGRRDYVAAVTAVVAAFCMICKILESDSPLMLWAKQPYASSTSMEVAVETATSWLYPPLLIVTMHVFLEKKGRFQRPQHLHSENSIYGSFAIFTDHCKCLSRDLMMLLRVEIIDIEFHKANTTSISFVEIKYEGLGYHRNYATNAMNMMEWRDVMCNQYCKAMLSRYVVNTDV